MTLREKLRHLPTSPGCYLYRDRAGEVIYVGKAKNLRHRVRQYFQASLPQDVKTAELVAHIADVEYIVTDTEIEALILESHLIKRHQPRFNVLLKDDKHYPHVKLTINEPYPRVLKVRRIEKDGALYFGPYLPASLADKLVELIHREFHLRPCSNEVFELYQRRGRPCLQYHIKRCLGPCVHGLFSLDHYQEAVRDVKLFLEGKDQALVESLRQRMEQAADELRFEAAARYRDLIRVVEQTREEQKMALGCARDIDVFGYDTDGSRVALSLFTLREGKVVGKRDFFWEGVERFRPEAFFSEVVTQYYDGAEYVPAEIHLPVALEDRRLIESWLSEKCRRRVRVLDPQRGVKRDLLELVMRNARLAFEQRFRVGAPARTTVLAALAEALDLPRPPHRIEAFDISTLQGSETVASLVVCEDGAMKRSDYRRFLIETTSCPDDYAAMREVIRRRYARQLREGRELPDLILVDGGKGQLRAALRALNDLGLIDLPVAALAKREEILFVKGRENEPLKLERHSPALHLIQMIRDEAHRFAVTFHRQRRRRRDLTSELLAIPGIGEIRKNRLLRNLGSIERIRRATVEELRPFVGEELARRIVAHFSSQRSA
jgi:excinuclease ABC subunit C